MTLNSKALQHYNSAVALLSLCDSIDDNGEPILTTNQVMSLCARAEAEISCAHFAVDNHALVMGIDEGQVPTAPPGQIGGPQVWGSQA